MTTQEQLARIYEAMARKGDSQWIYYLGHPVLLSDVFNYIKNMYDSQEEWYYNAIDYHESKLRKYWELSKPTIDEQAQECIQYISDLIPNN